MNRDVNVLLPAMGDGWTSYHRGRHGENQWGTRQTIAKVLRLAYYWHMLHPDLPVQIGHISKHWGGPFHPHKQHASGFDVDIRPFRTDGLSLPTTVWETAYAEPVTHEFVRLLHKVGKPLLVVWNDPHSLRAGLSIEGPHHNDHLHVRF